MRARRPPEYVGALGTAVLVLFAIGMAAIIYLLPSAAAATCPACYGLKEAQHGIYVQRSLSAAQQAGIVSMIESAQHELTDFWGPLQASPRILVCSDEGCFRRLGGGGRRGMSLYDKVAVLSPRGSNVTIAAHELPMNEMHHRIGWWAFTVGRMPIWFDEGIAMIASDDLRYLLPAGQADRCLVSSSAAMPTGMLEWNKSALTDHQLYAKAACRTSQWLTAHGGTPAVVALVDRMASGSSFEEASR
ncbi:hypothetical protein [Aquitalea pelogenes]|uniref:hypothetical protein n=1 Tax=Aquitalea pelogenes TaxID=1293573 RepID=UPI0007874E3C|nr:hypothetical protein [Aquitalea pelogenes]